LSRFSLARKEEDLRKLNEEINRQETKIAEKDREVKNLRDEIAKVAGLVGNRTEMKRNLEDNFQYRNSLREEKDMIEEIEGLQTELSSKGDLHMLEADLKRANGDLQRLLSEVGIGRRQNSFNGAKVLFSILIYILRSVKIVRGCLKHFFL